MSSATVERRMPARRRRRRLLKRGAWDLLGIALFVVLVFPVYWMVSTAFKPDEDIYGAEPTWFSLSPTLKHFRDAMARPYFWDIVQNSLIVVLVAVGASIVLAFLAAVALAKYRFTGRKLFVVVMIGILMLPTVGLVIPLYVVLAKYHLTNALTGVILTDQQNHTITVWLAYFVGTSRNTDWGALMAASTLTAIPVVVFFLIVQRRIAFGLTSGAVRG